MPPRLSRLSRSSDFQLIYRRGSSTASRFLVLYSFKRPAEAKINGPRLGLSVSKKMGGAVVRNRIKEYDLVLIARPQLLDLLTRESAGEKGLIGDAVHDLFRRAGLLREAASS
jgi:ribonuclease P protein component